MKRILVSIEDRHLPLLAKSKNQSQAVRDALDKVLSDIPSDIHGDITSPVMSDILQGLKSIYNIAKQLDAKVDRLAGVPTIPTQPTQPNALEGVADLSLPNIGLACCIGRNPCRHWSFDGTTALWTNSLTGKTREA